MDDIRLVRTVLTCDACPSQWDGWDEDGQYYYLRYRSGIGTTHKEASPDWVKWKYNDETCVRRFQFGDQYAGIITLKDFAKLANITLIGNEHDWNNDND